MSLLQGGIIDMTVERAVYSFAGAMVMMSVALTIFVSHYWIIFTIFIGLNLFQSGFTGICPAAMIFRKLGLKNAGSSCKDG